MTDVVERLRRACLALPEVEERLSHGTSTWFVQGKKTLVQLWPDGHHQDEFPVGRSDQDARRRRQAGASRLDVGLPEVGLHL